MKVQLSNEGPRSFNTYGKTFRKGVVYDVDDPAVIASCRAQNGILVWDDAPVEEAVAEVVIVVDDTDTSTVLATDTGTSTDVVDVDSSSAGDDDPFVADIAEVPLTS